MLWELDHNSYNLMKDKLKTMKMACDEQYELLFRMDVNLHEYVYSQKKTAIKTEL